MYGEKSNYQKTLEWASHKYDEYKNKSVAQDLKWSTEIVNGVLSLLLKNAAIASIQVITAKHTAKAVILI